ncbi:MULTISPECIES: alpha-amylase family glycosyl hydrolase [unclassified Carboxylicivirga]|uniref:alpha-amylase family glycosyl hydrolase n=1 Tax=Carboxylicivirga TaxID=1628153 RepID=UPI003D33173B
MSASKMIIYQLLPRLFGNTNTSVKPDGSRSMNGCGKFSAISERALDAFCDMGITHLWLTGVIEHAIVEGYPQAGIEDGNPLLIKGKAGSPYAIKDYYDVNPDLADKVNNRMVEFEALVARIHRKGLKVLIDFVPNHLSRVYRSDRKPKGIDDFGAKDDSGLAFSPSNNYYYLPGQPLQLPETLLNCFPDAHYEELVARATGNDVFRPNPGKDDWYETVKLNYGIDYRGGAKKYFDPIPDTWHKMLHILHYWAAKGVDGFRCDMAEMVPVEFWQWAITQLKSTFPWLVFIAEIYQPALYRTYLKTGNFDFLYDKVGLYDTLLVVSQGKQPATHISQCWQSLQGIDKYMLRFMENHDEQRLASRFLLGDGSKAIPAVVVAALMHQGPLLLYNGQEVGERGEGPCGYSGDDGRSTIFDYWNLPEHQKWMNEGSFDGAMLSPDQHELRRAYCDIIDLCKQPAVTSGLFYDLVWYNRNNPAFNSDKVYAFLRYSDEQCLLVLVNFANEKQQIRLQLPAHALQLLNMPRPMKITFQALGGSYEVSIGSEELIGEGLAVVLDAYSYKVMAMTW